MRLSTLAISSSIAVAAIAVVFAQPSGINRPVPPGTATGIIPASSVTSTAKDVQQTLQDILEEPASPEVYHYDPQGRRDPFQSLIGPAPKLQGGQRPPGVPGFLIDELKLQGVVRTRQGLVAMMNGPDNKGYLVHVGDKVLDGEIIRITQTSIVFRQEVNDPTRIERYREVIKELSSESQRK